MRTDLLILVQTANSIQDSLPAEEDEDDGKEEKMKTGKTMKTNRKLRDYPQIPATPPPSEKKERGIVHLEEELEHERKYLGALCMENQELEEILQDLDKEIAYIKSNFPQQIAGDGKVHANNEFWLKYESQLEVNRKLEREKKHLLNEIRQIEEQGLINLDSLSQTELILYVKQLERTKTDLLSDLRCKEWGLDRQAKDIHHLNEMKRTLQAEIRHYDKEFAMFRHYKKTSCPSASPTDSRHSSVVQDRKLKFPKQKERGKSMDDGDAVGGDDVRNSLSQENVTETSKNEVMFSSLDESKLERMECESSGPGYRRRSLKGVTSERKGTVAEVKRGPVKKTVSIASLPEVSKTKSKTPSPRIASRTKRSKTESKVKKSKAVRLKAGHVEKAESRAEGEDGVVTEVQRHSGDTKVLTFEPERGKQFVITVRIVVRILSNDPKSFTVDTEETTVLPL